VTIKECEESTVTPQEFSLLVMSILASVGGQVFLKVGALKLGRVNIGNTISHILSIMTIPELVIGLTCYGLGAFAYILLLTRVKLSIAGPSVSLVYVFSVLLGYFLFRETIPLTRLVGLSLIVGGVILVVWQK
jgi:drug/metabolite transporter (DMT)-like permease